MDYYKYEMSGIYHGFAIKEVDGLFREKIDEMIQRIDDFEFNEFF